MRRLILLAAAVAFVAACSDSSSPSSLNTEGPAYQIGTGPSCSQNSLRSAASAVFGNGSDQVKVARTVSDNANTSVANEAGFDLLAQLAALHEGESWTAAMAPAGAELAVQLIACMNVENSGDISAAAFEAEHIPGAINIPHRSMNEATTASVDRMSLVVTYCDGIGCNASAARSTAPVACTKAAYISSPGISQTPRDQSSGPRRSTPGNSEGPQEAASMPRNARRACGDRLRYKARATGARNNRASFILISSSVDQCHGVSGRSPA